LGGRKADQQLDSESEAGLARLKAADQEINEGLDGISNSLDRLGAIALSINDEVTKTTI
jgi:hypothetical protein